MTSVQRKKWYHGRCWQKVSQIRAFGDNFDRKRAKSTGANFEKALARVLQSDASSEMPEFAIGTLPVKYKSSPAQCVEALRKSMGDELWFQHFTYSRKHHAKTYVYDTSREKANDKGNRVSPALNVRRLNLSETKEGKCQVMTNEKKSLAGTKLLHELEVVDISDGSEVGYKHVTDWQANGTLQQKRQSDGSPRPTKAKRQKAKAFAPIHASEPSKSAAEIAVKERKAGYVKGAPLCGYTNRCGDKKLTIIWRCNMSAQDRLTWLLNGAFDLIREASPRRRSICHLPMKVLF